MWWHGPMVTFDLETTSADPMEARIVSAAVCVVGAGRASDLWSVMVNPGVEIPEQAAAIHGISTERARASGLNPVDALTRIMARLRARPDDAPLVIFNAPYDATVFAREMERHLDASVLDQFGGLFRRVVDPLVLDKHLNRYRSGKRKLGAICGFYGARLDEAHDPSSDAVAAARAAWVLMEKGQVIRRTRNVFEAAELRELEAEWAAVREDLDGLHAAQARWARFQQDGLAEYFAVGNLGKGVPPQPDRVVPRGWPVFEEWPRAGDAVPSRVAP